MRSRFLLWYLPICIGAVNLFAFGIEVSMWTRLFIVFVHKPKYHHFVAAFLSLSLFSVCEFFLGDLLYFVQSLVLSFSFSPQWKLSWNLWYISARFCIFQSHTRWIAANPVHDRCGKILISFGQTYFLFSCVSFSFSNSPSRMFSNDFVGLCSISLLLLFIRS